MKTFVLVIAGCLIGAGTSSAGILKMNCKKPICPCTCYGPCAGYFPTQWRVWPCPTPSPVVEAAAPAVSTPKPAVETPPPAAAPAKKTGVDVIIPPTAQVVPTVPAYIQQTWHVAP